MRESSDKTEGLKGFPWRISYRTSAVKPDGKSVDILHDFYIPVLLRSVRYDRVAGYFRSTSLAAASQGFSAFAGREGQMRLIVGADLEHEDVAAILQGSEERLEKRLNDELEGLETWPEEVVRGVQLLGWMVARERLEVRVAFRVHALTGEPLAVDAVEDGYVHMKWGLFADSFGSRLYISGSLNESKSALTLNAENIDVHCDWQGNTELLRVEEAEQEFESLWNDQNPALRVLTIPEAVRRRLIQFGESLTGRPLEIDGTSAAPVEVAPPSTFIKYCRRT
ncbi:hypothetical protein [Desulfoferrobacter suflitae]|uniref:hypothetical protein n=1 Tax=Desulfoferrobacter suflitae TaxID=2865782 RepID=UPI002164AD79|nr:hypothetical protein [Desulfoferrobacter suflitae]MCK8603177.1 hypothetical protein [Desulfoferrobacter suflitae]